MNQALLAKTGCHLHCKDQGVWANCFLGQIFFRANILKKKQSIMDPSLKEKRRVFYYLKGDSVWGKAS